MSDPTWNERGIVRRRSIAGYNPGDLVGTPILRGLYVHHDWTDRWPPGGLEAHVQIGRILRVADSPFGLALRTALSVVDARVAVHFRTTTHQLWQAELRVGTKSLAGVVVYRGYLGYVYLQRLLLLSVDQLKETLQPIVTRARLAIQSEGLHSINFESAMPLPAGTDRILYELQSRSTADDE